MLALPRDVRVDGEPDRHRQADPGGAAGEAHPERLAEDLAAELHVAGAESALDPEVAEALENGGGDRVREGEPADD